MLSKMGGGLSNTVLLCFFVYFRVFTCIHVYSRKYAYSWRIKVYLSAFSSNTVSPSFLHLISEYETYFHVFIMYCDVFSKSSKYNMIHTKYILDTTYRRLLSVGGAQYVSIRQYAFRYAMIRHDTHKYAMYLHPACSNVLHQYAYSHVFATYL